MTFLILVVAQYLFIPIGIVAGLFWVTLPPADKRWSAITGALSGLFGFLLTKLAGVLYYDPRPFVVNHVAPLFLHAPDNGFPSDHTVLTTVIALTVLQQSRVLGLILLLLGVAVGLARVLARVHWPLDVLAGVVIGSVAVGLARSITHRFLRSRS
jgi:undecaprenyl-diphosphatase